MTSTLDIREMRHSDLEAVLRIQASCFAEPTQESKESLGAKLRASPSTCFVASIKGEAVGYLISVPVDFSAPPSLNEASFELHPQPNCLYLHDLSVAPTARRSGAGRALVEACLSRLQVLGLGRASLIAVQDSARYWRRHGFRSAPLTESLKIRLSSYGQGVEYLERKA